VCVCDEDTCDSLCVGRRHVHTHRDNKNTKKKKKVIANAFDVSMNVWCSPVVVVPDNNNNNNNNNNNSNNNNSDNNNGNNDNKDNVKSTANQSAKLGYISY